MTSTEFRKVIQRNFKFANANMKDVLDERNDSRYWEGYREALLDLMSTDVILTLNDELNND